MSKVIMKPGQMFTTEIVDMDRRHGARETRRALWKVIKQYDDYVLAEYMKGGKPLYRQCFSNHDLPNVTIL